MTILERRVVIAGQDHGHIHWQLNERCDDLPKEAVAEIADSLARIAVLLIATKRRTLAESE